MSSQAQTPTSVPTNCSDAFADGNVLLHAAGDVSTLDRPLLFTEPSEVIVAVHAAELAGAFDRIEQRLAEGSHLAGYVTYEAGLALHGLLAHPLPPQEPLLCFGVYRKPKTWSPDPAPPVPLDLALLPTLSRPAYERTIHHVQEWIAQGDIYQANYTIPLQSECTQTTSQLFHALLAQQPAAFSAAISLRPAGNASPTVLSFSPELFFRTTAHGSITMRPMKGTLVRSEACEQDDADAAWLSADAKNRAEHVMIVDLLRNDLGRICETGSVHVPELFRIESLPTVHQMVSDVHSHLRPNTSWLQIFRALFPSGSITGAPKRRAMQRLHQVENTPRGVYTGAIGHIAPDGSSCFSVAIRTLTVRSSGQRRFVTCGVGGGVVTDSTASEEYAEALVKAAFIRRASVPLELIETMLVRHGEMRWPDQHLRRLQRSAYSLGFAFDENTLRDAVTSAAQSLAVGEHRLRLTLQPNGMHSVTSQPLTHWPPELRVRLASQRSHMGDPALDHKTNFRSAYDQELAAAKAAGYDEALFANDAGLLTEGCVTNFFVIRAGELFTPYQACGVLPGILRGELLQRELATESLVPIQGLEACDGLLMGNSLRGLYPVVSLQLDSVQTLTWNVRHLQARIYELHKTLGIH